MWSPYGSCGQNGSHLQCPAPLCSVWPSTREFQTLLSGLRSSSESTAISPPGPPQAVISTLWAEMKRQQSFPALIPTGIFPGLSEHGTSGSHRGHGYSGQTELPNPTAGNSYEMDAIGACFIGGASAYGGTGTVPGVIVGATLMGVLNLGMSIMGVDQNLQRRWSRAAFCWQPLSLMW